MSGGLYANYFKSAICNVDNIMGTNIYNYTKIGMEFINFEICNICGNEKPEICESAEIYCHNDLNFPICDKCYNNLPKPSICRKCGKDFPSRNLLFAHLNEFPEHKLDPIVYDKGRINILCSFDSDLFNISLEDSKKSPFYYEWNEIFKQKFLLSVGDFKAKIRLKTIRESWEIDGVDSINIEYMEGIGRIIFNDDITVFVKNNIGWINWRNDYYIPILKIEIEV